MTAPRLLAAAALGASVVACASALAAADQPARAPGWTLPMRVAPVAEGTEGPQPAVTPSGRAAIAWNAITFTPDEGVAGGQVLAAVRDDVTGRFGPPEVVSGSDRSALAPSLAAAGETLVALWGNALSPAGAVLRTAARAPGGAWSLPAELGRALGGALGLSVAANMGGEAVAVWAPVGAEDEDAVVQALVRSPDGAWSPSATISGDDRVGHISKVAIGADGTAAVAWWARAGRSWSLRAAVRPGGAQFGEPVTVTTRPVRENATIDEPPARPHVSVGGGTALVVWTNTAVPRQEAPHAALLTAAGGRFGPWRLSRSTRSVDAEGGMDAAGAATVAWSTFVTPDRAVLRVAERPAGGRFSAPRPVLRSGGCDTVFEPRLAVAPDGAALLAWETTGAQYKPLIAGASREPGGAFVDAAILSRDEGRDPALAGSLVTWTGDRSGLRGAGSVTAAKRREGALGLPQEAPPRLTGVQVPAVVAAGATFPLRLRLSRPATVELLLESVGERPAATDGFPELRPGRQGSNLIRLPARSRYGALAPGRYRLLVSAEAAGRESCRATVHFRVRGPASAKTTAALAEWSR
jgi:hypothetical protein